MKNVSNKRAFQIAFAAIMIALSAVLDFAFKAIPLLDMPRGGSVTITMLPIVVAGVVCGPLYGVIAGVGFGIINCFLIDAYGWLPSSFILDYVVGFGALGLVGIFRKQIYEGKKIYFVLGFIMVFLIRWIAAGISGVINFEIWGYTKETLEEIFGAGKNSTGYIYLFSFFVYNFPYLSLSTLVCIIIGLIGYKPIFKVIE